MPATNNQNSSLSSKAHGEKSASFEESFARLQAVVARLSDGNLSLQEALSAYEEGMELADRCARMLDEAELRVKQVSERAMKAGAATLESLRASGLGSQPTPIDGLVAIEIDAYESTLFFDEPAAPTSKPQDDKTTPTSKRVPKETRLKPEDLDPLFDDEE